MIYNVIVTPEAEEGLDMLYKSGNKKLVEKALVMLEEISRTPRSGTGKPEQLKGYNEEMWSRCINSRHRLIYEIQEDYLTVYAISAFGHYGDK
ncbi:MAG: Txe/YoeB family addiction module toxin [bacterium]